MEFALIVLLCAGEPGAACSPTHFETLAFARGPISRNECNAAAIDTLSRLPSPPDGRWYFGSCVRDEIRKKLEAAHV